VGPVPGDLEDVHEEPLGEGERGLLFEAGDVLTMAAQLNRLVGDPQLRRRLSDAAVPLRAAPPAAPLRLVNDQDEG